MWEKNKERKRKNTVNSGHLVLCAPKPLGPTFKLIDVIDLGVELSTKYLRITINRIIMKSRGLESNDKMSMKSRGRESNDIMIMKSRRMKSNDRISMKSHGMASIDRMNTKTCGMKSNDRMSMKTRGMESSDRMMQDAVCKPGTDARE